MTDHIVPSHDGPATNPTTHFERKDVNIRGVVLVGGILAVVVVVGCIVSWWVFDYLQARDRASKVSPFPLAAEDRARLPSEPRLEQIERMEGAKTGELPTPLYDTEQHRLKTYGWVDEKEQVARIPIDRAMKLIVEEKRLRSRPDAAKAEK
jgi:hypothetical protein